jgi:hypothetical protein
MASVAVYESCVQENLSNGVFAAVLFINAFEVVRPWPDIVN